VERAAPGSQCSCRDRWPESGTGRLRGEELLGRRRLELELELEMSLLLLLPALMLPQSLVAVRVPSTSAGPSMQVMLRELPASALGSSLKPISTVALALEHSCTVPKEMPPLGRTKRERLRSGGAESCCSAGCAGSHCSSSSRQSSSTGRRAA
jgi:hypothetical protein